MPTTARAKREAGDAEAGAAADLRAEARQLEMELFGPRPGSSVSHRADRRASTVQRQERERDAQQWRARLRDRAPIGPGSPGSDS